MALRRRWVTRSAPNTSSDSNNGNIGVVDGRLKSYEAELVEIRKDDQRIDPAEWTIASVPGGERPKVEIRLVGHGIDSTVVLPTASPSVFRVDADKPEPFARDVIDLDQAGRDREPW